METRKQSGKWTEESQYVIPAEAGIQKNEKLKMKNNRFIIFLLMLTTYHLLLTTSVFSQSGYPGDWLFFPPTARTLSLGGVSETGAASLYFNPALLGYTYWKETSFMRSSLLGDSIFLASFLSIPVNTKKVIAMGFASLGITGAEWVDSYGFGNRGTFADRKTAFFAGGCIPFGRFSILGGTLKIVEQEIFNYSARSFGLDFGYAYSKSENFIFSFAIQNLVRPTLQFRDEGEKDKFPTNLRIGINWRTFKNLNLLVDILGENLTPQSGEKTNYIFLSGIEATFFEMLKLRAGWDGNSPSFGTGFNLGKFDFDFTALLKNEEQFFTAGIVLRWGYMPDFWQEQLAAKEKFLKDYSKNLEVEKKYILKKEEDLGYLTEQNVKVRLRAAKRYVRNHEYSMAMTEIEEILKIQPENEEALKLKKDIKSGKLKADLYYALALQYYRNGAYKDALKKVKKARKLNRDHTDAEFLYHMIIARIFIDKGEYFQAKAHLLDAFKIYPENEECLTLLNGINDLLKAKGK